PPAYDCRPYRVGIWQLALTDEAYGQVTATGRERVVDGGGHVPLLLVPLRCPHVEGALPVGIAAVELRPQQIAEQMVVAIRPLPVVQADDEHVGVLQTFQDRRAVRSSEQGVAQR